MTVMELREMAQSELLTYSWIQYSIEWANQFGDATQGTIKFGDSTWTVMKVTPEKFYELRRSLVELLGKKDHDAVDTMQRMYYEAMLLLA